MRTKPHGFDPTKPQPLPDDFRVPGYVVLHDWSDGSIRLEDSLLSWHIDWAGANAVVTGRSLRLENTDQLSIYSCDQLLRRLMGQGLREEAEKFLDLVKGLASLNWHEYRNDTTNSTTEDAPCN